ncbi:type VII secretion-associated serine protease mycosin [Actinoplanes philippinensis]|uniref:Type VII secretion-associated serine protease mycosin n=1 Tax=Actinoplanes philippinensis TaxID=35752 RepID=A0A1I2J787_9ACTN|nr:type VII secretion-associated serine protease mycosin [Actinoplanes philippinensis]SFF49898.1 type VII secretion-associated serine protease mycosin [Actinoplanes philippinensis]
MTLFPGLPARADQIRELQWHVNYLHLEEAHRITKGRGVIVAVPDTGVSPHLDLKNNLTKGVDTRAGGDGIGQSDHNGHGTQMAGLISAHGHGNNDGVIGVAPEAQILPIMSLDSEGRGAGVEKGIKWAAQAGADVINVSSVGGASRPLSDAIAAAARADSVVVAGTGNTSTSPKLGYPAAIPGVLAVGAIDRSGKHADFSITGPKVEICAPGVDIVSIDLNGKYSKSKGTSSATAIVSGAAALVRAKFPDLSAAEVIHRLTATADDNGAPGRDDECGYGVLNVVKALTADVPPLSSTGGTASAAPRTSDSAPAGISTPSITPSGTASPPEPAGSQLPLLAGIGIATAAVGVLLAILVRRRRAAS